MNRRTFLHSALTTAAAVAASGALGGYRALAVGAGGGAGQTPRPRGVPPEWRAKGRWVIPTNKPTRFGLKVMAFNPIPAPDPATWTLKIQGLVEEESTLNAADIDKLPRLVQNSRLKCVQCWSGRVKWEGFTPKELLKSTRLKPEAGWVRVDCADKYYDFVRLTDLFNERTIFAVGMNGEAMPPEHGAPLRLVLPFKYGYKSSKLITSLTFLDKGGRGMVTDGMPYYSESGDILPGIDHPFEFPDEARKIKGGEIFEY
jgi:methionine sulfoxide reductase catalytic subunit